ncbi:hypothetical protein Chor_002119 [Crotalus horridus]
MSFYCSYVISAPKFIRAGASEQVVIQAYGYTQEFSVTISMKSYPDKKMTYAFGTVQLTPANHFQGSVTLTVHPKDLRTDDPQKRVESIYLEAASPHFTRQKKMLLTYDNGFLFIQTDKPIYTPDQSVKVRVYSLNEELRPARRAAVLTFVDPGGAEVDIIREDDATGIISFPEFKIPPYPKFGIWTIIAKYDKEFTTSAIAKFQVKEYGSNCRFFHISAMPRFSVEIIPENSFISSQYFERFKITIQARYFYKKKLSEAEVYVRFGIVQGARKTMLPKSLRLIHARVRDMLDISVGNVPVLLTATALNDQMEETKLIQEGSEFGSGVTSSTDGTTIFTVTIPSDAKVLEFKARETYEAKSYISLNGNYLYIDWASDHRVLHVGESFQIKVHPASHYIDKILHYSYLILSRGKIISYGTQEKIEGLSYQGLNLHITEEMVPSARLLVYYIVTGEGTAELVADSVWLNVQQKCGNNLEVRILKNGRVYRPRESVSLSMTSESHSLVALSALDKAIYGVTGSKQKPMEKVTSGRKENLWLSRCLFRCPTDLGCALLKLEKSDLGCGAGGGENNVDVFRMAGLTFLTNANADDPREKVAQFQNQQIQKCCRSGAEPYPFPQTCQQRIKRIIKGGPRSKTLPVTLPDSLTTWEIQGVSISDKGTVVRQKEFAHKVPRYIVPKTQLEKTLSIKGIISVLSFQTQDYSYSMWKDGEASTWITAFILKVFGQVRRYMPDQFGTACQSLTWLIDICQMDDGSFREVSDYKPVALQGTLRDQQKENSLYLTAFTLIAFSDYKKACPFQVSLLSIVSDIAAAISQNTFVLAIVTYALTQAKVNHPDLHSAYRRLKNEAQVKGNPPIYRFWKEIPIKFDASIPSKGNAKMVETTAYALLSILRKGDHNYAKPVMKWLTEEQRFGGGFYSTQDTIIALECLTEYSILIRRLELDMNIKASYKSRGDFHTYRLTSSHYIGKPVDLRSVYYVSSVSEDTCDFQLKINVTRDEKKYYLSFNEIRLLVACAKSIHADSYGDSKDRHLSNSVDQLILNYEIRPDGHVVMQVDSIPGNEFLCVGFRTIEIYRVGMPSPGTFSVYDYHDPEKRCTIFYNAYGEESLVKLCEGSECKCMEAECGHMQPRLDTSITLDTRKEAACQQNIAYVYKVVIKSSKEEGSFVKYNAILLEPYKLVKKHPSATWVSSMRVNIGWFSFKNILFLLLDTSILWTIRRGLSGGRPQVPPVVLARPLQIHWRNLLMISFSSVVKNASEDLQQTEGEGREEEEGGGGGGGEEEEEEGEGGEGKVEKEKIEEKEEEEEEKEEKEEKEKMEKER